MAPSRKARADTGGVIVPIADGEVILRREKREVSILVAREEVTITHGQYSGGEQVAGPHVHREHTDAFYVLEGELTFEVGREAETIAVPSGGFVAAPPGVAHSFRNASDRPARWLTIHAQDGGFGAFMRGVRDGVEIEWDISAVPADGGLPARAAIVSPGVGGKPLGSGNRLCWLRCALPDIHVVEWHLRGPHADLPFHQQGRQADSFFVIEGELEAMLGGTRQTVGPGTLISVPRGVQHTLNCCGRARVLSLHTPDAGFHPTPASPTAPATSSTAFRDAVPDSPRISGGSERRVGPPICARGTPRDAYTWDVRRLGADGRSQILSLRFRRPLWMRAFGPVIRAIIGQRRDFAGARRLLAMHGRQKLLFGIEGTRKPRWLVAPLRKERA